MPSSPGVSTSRKSSLSSTTTKRQAADASGHKRRCISTACIACRKRKSKCDGALPSCAACASVYGTECIYDPSSDHRRKGVYRERADSIKARASTLHIIVEAILNAAEDQVPEIVSRVRDCDSLDDLAQQIVESPSPVANPQQQSDDDHHHHNHHRHDHHYHHHHHHHQLHHHLHHNHSHKDHPRDRHHTNDASAFASSPPLPPPLQGEAELARKMGELRLENGSVRFIGGTSHLIYLPTPDEPLAECYRRQQPRDLDPVTSWTRVTADAHLIMHLIHLYFNYHYAYFTTLSKKLFWRDFARGASAMEPAATTAHCSPLLVNAILALGCHFTDLAGAYATPGLSRTKGDHFFDEAERLVLANEELAKPRLATVQALALMSVREAGCARESKGWVYSGMSFRMAQDLGLNLDIGAASSQLLSDDEIDARKITFWGCFFFDKCWSNYLGRLPQLPRSSSNVSKFDVFPDEDATLWSPVTDSGRSPSYQQPWRTRAAALLLSSLSEISSDLLVFFYHPNHIGRSRGKTAELKMLGEIHQRLEEWHRRLPKEFEPREGQLPHVTLIHMFYHLQYIHLFRPFLKYSASASPLPPHVSPRRICTTHAGDISKLMRQYKKTYNLRQICNIAVYMTHSACTIHLLNLPDKSARRDITHGVKHLEEMAEDWLCARRTLSILSVLARKWKCELPEDAASVLRRADDKYGHFSTSEVPSPEPSSARTSPTHHPADDPLVVPSLAVAAAAAAAGVGVGVGVGVENKNSSPVTAPFAVAAIPPPSLPVASHHHQQLAFGAADFRTDVLDGWAHDSTSLQQQQQQQQPAVAFNGQHWILTDSARWHQNFEGWGVGGGASSVFAAFDCGGGVGDGGHGECDDGSRIVPPALNGLTTAVMSDKGGWLPGLE
ncbi:hypothetical protein L249_4293 [Ophiocordyceps polyrhachis-furcata BCC 54312]|uniref:Zn(2)-C6 fungal-type domain-containing protein n=1 Tax=Ophiocordyceps polyrhachis-furcata BCC 54312 TaxID=1330021 RepID=A0A367L7G4_9HYPO|nr:hypothetical protein L249_4293 [Ophiocordyceps polyrhachis-furcata BCC 54312]